MRSTYSGRKQNIDITPRRRQSTCVSSSSNLSATQYSRSPRIERAHSTSHQGSGFKTKGTDGDNALMSIIARAQSQQVHSENGLLMPESNPRRIQRAHSHCPGADIRLLQKAASRSHRESVNSLNQSVTSKLYPSTPRRCSEAVAAYHATGDLEAARSLLLEARERSIARSINEGILNTMLLWVVIVLVI